MEPQGILPVRRNSANLSQLESFKVVSYQKIKSQDWKPNLNLDNRSDCPYLGTIS